jgi:hypothetical protein
MRNQLVDDDGVLWWWQLLRFNEWGGEKIGGLCEFDEKWGREVNKMRFWHKFFRGKRH